MGQEVRNSVENESWSARWAGWTSPFTAPVPSMLRAPLVELQHQRLSAMLPVLCLLIAANAIAMGLAVLGELPWWQQLLPPVLIVSACLAVLAHNRLRPCPRTEEARFRQLRHALFLTVPLGLVAGFWCVNAFEETEKYYCMVAPVFIGIAALVTATCLLSVPRAAIAAMVATVTPIVVKMAMFDNLGVRAMAVMMVLVTAMQAGVVLSKFNETLAMLTFQFRLNRLAETDALTGLDNRMAFTGKLRAALEAKRPILLALADLDGFKAANDSHGHHAGDAILTGVAERMSTLAPEALAIARLGGDEFALLFDCSHGTAQALDRIQAIRRTVALPFAIGDALVGIGISFGTATNPADGTGDEALLRVADRRLYADKASRKAASASRAEKAPRQSERRRNRVPA